MSESPRNSRSRRYVPAVGPRLRRLLVVVLALFAILTVNSVYLGAVTLAEWWTGETYQNLLYQFMFLGHLGLGLLMLLPVIIYGAIHIHNAHGRPNRRAVKAGYALFTLALVLLFSGVLLTRGFGWLEVRHPETRESLYWIHVIAPLVVVWLFVLHRLAGKRIRWRVGGLIAAGAAIFAGIMLAAMMQDPRQWGSEGPASGEQYFFPSLARTATGLFIPAERLMTDDYCAECHADVHAAWSVSAHRFASFNNPAYLFSVRNTRRHAMERDGNVQAARFCAGCHDLVPFFSGAFDDPDFDDVNDPTAHAGITCTGCHAITHINSVRGNSDFTIEEPLYYPFTFSDGPVLSWINRTLVKAKPEFHKRTFLKPLHQSPEFCGTCHKVHLPESLNGYRWLRGQNHYDSYHLSGVSGHGITSFYYPPKAHDNCNGCHMVERPSDDFAARIGKDGELMVHDHQFPSANTGVLALLSQPEEAIQRQRDFLEGSLRVDLIALRKDGAIDGEIMPMVNEIPTIEPGQSYLLEVVLRTLNLGHLFTQGTADSNEVWVEIQLREGERVIGGSGARGADGSVDAWSHFVNAYVIDRQGQRIDRRNAEDIFTALYNHQIPPGAADSLHYRFHVPEDLQGPLVVEARLLYRKFDTRYLSLIQGEAFSGNDLPIIEIGASRVELPLSGPARPTSSAIDEWVRWNDYGIGLLRKPGNGQLRQAEEVFRRVAEMGRSEGLLNLARVYLREGRLDDAEGVLARAAEHPQLNYPWTLEWLAANLDFQNGFLDEAIDRLQGLIETRFNEARDRGFDFSQDYRLLERYGQILFERSRVERGSSTQQARDQFLERSREAYQSALALDPERASSHYGLAQVLAALGKTATADEHRALHSRYKVDDNARDQAVAAARRMNPAADHAADAVVIYNLQRDHGVSGAIAKSGTE